MFTNEAFLELEPDLIVQLIPLGRSSPRTTVLAEVYSLLKEQYPAMLIDYDKGMIVLNTKKRKV